ncbi:MAG: hypothetical protein DRP01_05125 [Archaeoglobales archaeon]|nr:MAG: hypothetical protein DRP01_05125 [Archaeoglobales archaeon]
MRAILVLVVFLMFCVSLDVTSVTPDEIMGMKKMVCAKGDEALEIVKRMHVGEIRDVRDIALMHYIGNSSFVTVWVTVYPNESVAFGEIDRMANSMLSYGWKVEDVILDGHKVYVAIPPDSNERQYFWCVENYAYYIIPHNLTDTQVVEFIAAIS